MRRTVQSILSLLLIVIIFSVQIQSSVLTEFGGATYQFNENVETNELPFGIMHYRDLGLSGSGATLVDQQVNVLEIPASEDIKIVPWSKINPSKWQLASVTSIAKDFEAKNPGYRVIGAINGDFFDISGTRNLPFATVGVHVSGGEFYKTTDSGSSTRLTVGFKNDGSVHSLVGNKPLIKTSQMILSIYDEEDNIINEFNIDKVNQSPGTNEIAVYYANWNDSKVIVPIQVENGFIVSNATHALAFSQTDFYGIGTISSYESKMIGEREFALVSNNQTITQLLQVGVKIRVQYRFAGDFSDVEYATGCGKPIIYENTFMPDTTDFGVARHPRTMIGIKADGSILMTVVDGRQPSIGMNGVSQTEMGAILHHYGAVEAYNLDGGGSSAMIILEDGDFRVTNSPSDGRERSDANALLVVVRVPSVSFTPTNIVHNGISIQAQLNGLNGYDFTDLYVGLNNEIKMVQNGVVHFSDLESNTSYRFDFYYKKDEEFIKLAIQDRVMTAKKTPVINYVSIYYDGTDLLYIMNITDDDKAITRNAMSIDGVTKIAVSNRVSFANLNGNIGHHILSLRYDLNDGNGAINIELSDFRIRSTIQVCMNIMQDKLDQQLKGIIG